MILYALKVIFLFTFAIIALRMMGKSTLAQVTPHDLVAIVMVAALATHPILVNNSRKILLAIVLIALIHLIYGRLTLYKWTNRMILGEPTILIKHGKIIKENLRRCEISLPELLATIRYKGYPDLRDVQYAILEPTGTISVLPRDELYPATPRDLRIDVPYRGLSLPLVIDGHIQKGNLRLIGKDTHWLKEELKKKGFNDIRRVVYAATRERQPELYVDDGEGRYF